MTSITTPRLLLRPFQVDDFAALREIEGDPEVLRHRSRRAISEVETRAFLADCQRLALDPDPPLFPWAVVLLPGGRLIGQIGLTRLVDLPDEAFLWFALNRQFWGSGYMTESVIAVRDDAFGRLGLQRLHARCQTANLGAMRVLEKAGLLRVGTIERGEEGGGAFEAYDYALSREDWLARTGESLPKE